MKEPIEVAEKLEAMLARPVLYEFDRDAIRQAAELLRAQAEKDSKAKDGAT